MLSGFKQFILRGNVIDMAVGVVIGAAFGTVVTALTKDLLTPLIAAIVGKPDFSAISSPSIGAVFAIGDFINAAISFLLMAAAVYFFVVTPVNAAGGADAQSSRARRSHHQEVPGMLERDSDRCPALHALRAAGDGQSSCVTAELRSAGQPGAAVPRSRWSFRRFL